MMYSYYLRKGLRDKGFVFWSLAFPLLLMLCFSMTFKDAGEGDFDFNPVKCAVIETTEASAFSMEFENVVESLTDAETVKESNLGYNHEILNQVKVNSQEEAEKKILEREIDVLFLVDGKNEKIDAKVGDGAGETTLMISRGVVESYRKNYAIMKDCAMTAPDKMALVLDTISNSIPVMQARTTYLGNDGSSANMYNWYYYSTIVMGMFFNVSTGVKIVFDIQGNLSGAGMRTSISPKKKSKILMSAFLARYTMVCAISFFHILMLNKVFEIPIGNRVWQLLLFVLLGNLFSTSLGSMFALFTKGEENSREGKATGFIMLSVFLSGEMLVVLPGIFERYCPIINRINPATLMNFAFYRLVHYPTLTGFWINMAKIAVATVVFLSIAILKLRREKYAAV